MNGIERWIRNAYHYLIQKVLRKLIIDFLHFQESVEICRHEIGDEITLTY